MTAILCFADVETMGLEPRRHVIWEFAATRATPYDDGSGYKTEDLDLLIHVEPDEIAVADATALRINGFYDRYTEGNAVSRYEAAEQIARFTAGCTLLAAVPSFDDMRLDHLLRSEGWSPAWHYHLACVENLCAGYIRGMYAACEEMGALETEWGKDVAKAATTIAQLPWSSDALSAAVGVQPTRFGRHTSRGDVDWAIALYEKVYGVTVR